ncbi:MAG: fructosamine kinase family protein [Rhodospirillales bacterium]|nr:fructosamine kinase family protein [Rhodospirillales bacterium]
MSQDIKTIIARTAGSPPMRFTPLGGGCVADVRAVTLADGRTLVAKVGDAGANLDLEGFMLQYLRDPGGLPVPDVLYADDTLLLMSRIETLGGLDADAQNNAADLLAGLHGVTAKNFGFERATVIGGLHQPNPETQHWTDFFRDQRLLYMARQALDAGRLPPAVMARVEVLAAKLDTWLDNTAAPALIHGDLWGGNVLSHRGRISGFIDPALYYADAEIELAFSTLFDTFGDAFFRRYNEHRPIRPGFFEERRDLYNLYPLLVHVRLFGGGYVGSVERTLAKYGC